jgi:hypothetical protein
MRQREVRRREEDNTFPPVFACECVFESICVCACTCTCVHTYMHMHARMYIFCDHTLLIPTDLDSLCHLEFAAVNIIDGFKAE